MKINVHMLLVFTMDRHVLCEVRTEA